MAGRSRPAATEPTETETPFQTEKPFSTCVDREQVAEGLFLLAFSPINKIKLSGHASFCGFQRFSLNVSSLTSFLTWVAKLQEPFAHLMEVHSRFAIRSGSIVHRSIASLTRLHDRIASPTVIGAAVLLIKMHSAPTLIV